MFTSTAYALGAAPQGGAGAPEGLAGLLAGPLPMLVLMFAIFYFLLIRPQQKKAKQHKEMLAAMKVGDKVMTGGGFYGRITEIDQDILTVEIAENVRVKINRGYIAGPADASVKVANAK
ncbi:MAG: preprotein translocase subunit YajC [Desulfovibrio sp.]